MSLLETWLAKASRGLSADAALQLQKEITEHYRCSYDDAIASGHTAEGAERQAVEALGDARLASRLYRRVLLTAFEARCLHLAARIRRAMLSDDVLAGLVVTLQLIWIPIVIWWKWSSPLLSIPIVVMTWVAFTRWNSDRRRNIMKWAFLLTNAYFTFSCHVGPPRWIFIPVLPFLAYLDYRLAILRRKLRIQPRPEPLRQ